MLTRLARLSFVTAGLCPAHTSSAGAAGWPHHPANTSSLWLTSLHELCPVTTVHGVPPCSLPPLDCKQCVSALTYL